MEILWSLYVLVLFSVDAAHSHDGSQGLSCVNDFFNKVSCTWGGSAVAPGVRCWISGLWMTWNYGNKEPMIGKCELDQHGNSPPGCSFTFKNKHFTPFSDFPYIRMECNGTLVANLTKYKLREHIKMNPPGVPLVNVTANDTWIRWTAGSYVSDFIKSFNFQVEITQNNQIWRPLSMQKLEQRIPSWKLKGHCQVRVRVCPADWEGNHHWSDWSPTTSWTGATDKGSQNDARPAGKASSPNRDQTTDWFLDQTSLIRSGVIVTTGLIMVVILILSWRCMRKGPHLVKEVPTPSKYFQTLHSVHGGNLKKWLNSLSAAESFFTAQPCDHISPVEFCEASDVVPSGSPSSSPTSALLHFTGPSSAGSDTSGVVDNSSSSSSSCFSNMGYFMSSSSGGSARTDHNPAYFSYQEDIRSQHVSHNLHLSLHPPTATSPTYESLKTEPQSPDSGFGIEMEEEENKRAVAFEREGASNDHHSSPLFILPLHLPSFTCPPSSPPPPPDGPGPTQVSPDSPQVAAPVAAASGNYAAWPLAGAMCRSSSMPVESCKTGYLTLKELQTTFSNKSI